MSTKFCTTNVALRGALFGLLLFSYIVSQTDSANNYTEGKWKAFQDPNTGYIYNVTSYHAVIMTTDSSHHSMIKVTRRIAQAGPNGRPENVMTLPFHPRLVDFDLDCVPSHCYLVAVTSRTRENVELYSWQRTQFDLLVKKDSFARPHAVKLFHIPKAGFYIAIAQDQLHLSPNQLVPEDEDPARFIGCAILKFNRNDEHDLKYHQFIRLPFHPKHVANYRHTLDKLSDRIIDNYYLVFSEEPNWDKINSLQTASFTWSSLNDYFWPHRLPRSVKVIQSAYPKLEFPTPLPTVNQTRPVDHMEPIESCFSQLQRLLIDREQLSRKLIDSSHSLWRSAQNRLDDQSGSFTNIAAPVYVHGNVVVHGSVMESPQISILGRMMPQNASNDLDHLMKTHSPAVVEQTINIALFKLKRMRDKLSKAVSANSTHNFWTSFNSPLKFYAPLRARKVTFRNNGIANSNVRLNGIPFMELQHGLVNLRGDQDVAAKVTFHGSVTADFLEIHGLINNAYLLKDAIDIKSNTVQVIDIAGTTRGSTSSGWTFESVECPELVLTHSATINDVVLNDFITRDNRTQVIVGGKYFRHLFVNQLNLARPGVLLNGFNVSRIALNGLRQNNPQSHQRISYGSQTFSKAVYADRLIINNYINGHINISALIHDSVKVNELGVVQQITGHKHFLAGLSIGHLTTEGSINGVPIREVFSRNPGVPIHEYAKYANQPALFRGNFRFSAPVTVLGSLDTGTINGENISRRAIRRSNGSLAYMNQPQIVAGVKIFERPLRIRKRVGLRKLEQLTFATNSTTYHHPDPRVNGLDISLINRGIKRQFEQPREVKVENLSIEGNLILHTLMNYTGQSRIILGRSSVCPLDSLRTKLVLGGLDEQDIALPVRVESLRLRSAMFEPGSLNGLSFPEDFVLKSTPNHANWSSIRQQVQTVSGVKRFAQLLLAPPRLSSTTSLNFQNYFNSNMTSVNSSPLVTFGTRSSINNITYSELQEFINYEGRKNSTGETVFQTLNVYGNILVKRINGYKWPEDILLKSVASPRNMMPSAYSYHRRIYSPLIFMERSHLEVQNQLVLRGPIQLNGLLNNVNLTEFSHQSVTRGDKDLLSMGRPIRNKNFLGGLTVTEVRSQGLINGVDFNIMRNRVVTIGQSRERVYVSGPKAFLSNVVFLAPITMNYVNDIAIDYYLKKIHFKPGTPIQVFGRKMITGALVINKNLVVQGPINKIDFIDLEAKAISLSPRNDLIQFNKTLTIEGDVFMDNLLIDEKNGIVDGVKLADLVPIESTHKREFVISKPLVRPQNSTTGKSVEVTGSVNDCQITCSLAQPSTYGPIASPDSYNPYSQPQMIPHPSLPLINHQPVKRETYNTRTTPPYEYFNSSNVQTSPMEVSNPPMINVPITTSYELMPRLEERSLPTNLATRQPHSIRYEFRSSTRPPIQVRETSPINREIDYLRKQMVILNLNRVPSLSNLIIGFIEALSNDVRDLILPEMPYPHSGHISYPDSFSPLDQIDFPFPPTIYHFSVGTSTTNRNQSITTVLSSLGERVNQRNQIRVLPVEYPNSAKFLVVDNRTLFLLVSQDYTTYSSRNYAAQCPIHTNSYSTAVSHISQGQYNPRAIGGIHVYLFHALENSSLLDSAYFDLYQTIDLPTVDSFESFNYHGSTYALAVSKAAQRVFLLLLRGYSGFQIVSHIDTTMVEKVQVLFSQDHKPILMLREYNGNHKLWEPVII